MSIYLRDCETKEVVEFSDDIRCACCGSAHNPSRKIERLVIDHDWWNVPMTTRLLCGYCNIKKGNKRYVSFYDEIWIPGMKIGERIKKHKKCKPRQFATDRNRKISEGVKRSWKRRKRNAQLLDDKLGTSGAIR